MIKIYIGILFIGLIHPLVSIERLEVKEIQYKIENEIVSQEKYSEFLRKLSFVRFTEFYRNNPEKTYFKNYRSGLIFYEEKLILEKTKALFLIRKIQMTGNQIYKINEKYVSKEEFDLYLKDLKEIQETWYCKKESTGGTTGYDAKDQSDNIYKIIQSSYEEIGINVIVEKKNVNFKFPLLIEKN
ncbi:MAG TPA: hypothetical protein PK079_24915 [Leptospiraceae bacterium]|nr:hypothetical protein [Leptospiraceae bacterium]HMW08473.1 hypothetical protein [Leptospiraceae bacterium]HMX33944.1 hypothetical protein [Leptospiraceae bacterium]HMY34233.1 hypothetical protein [Leptospiraceae bacterium]HMZ66758.1 hypothetical protein [Leptospiraceae bacterium]